jgi:hypothetical protein
MILGSIYCPASSTTLDALLGTYGFRAVARDEAWHFDVTSMTRRSDPVVERDLFDLALVKLDAARIDGALPRWTLLKKESRLSR